MSDRPTPEQIVDQFGSETVNVIARLDHHGYVIVHPDDTPEEDESYDGHFEQGWNACREHIFGNTP